MTQPNQIYAFSWNLGGLKAQKRAEKSLTDENIEGAKIAAKNAHDLALRHLIRKASEGGVIACLQEVPGESILAKARFGDPASIGTTLKVVPNEKKEGKSVVTGLVILYSEPFELCGAAIIDEDDEFVMARLKHRDSEGFWCIIGVHAKSKISMSPSDIGGSRALLRHEVNRLWDVNDRLLILGDFNSDDESEEIEGWHCFWAPKEPVDQSSTRRRGHDHPPLKVIPFEPHPRDTYFFKESSRWKKARVDFFMTQLTCNPPSKARILTELVGESVSPPTLLMSKNQPKSSVFSDHLPVEVFLNIDGDRNELS